MYKSYFRIGWRCVRQMKLLSLIKILGLSIGLTACMLILLFTKDELSYDAFHDKKDQIYRVIQRWQFGSDGPRVIGATNAVVGEEFFNAIPEVEGYIRVKSDNIIAKKHDRIFTEEPLFVDNNFFSIFSFPLIEGDPATALNDLHAVVISEEVAQKYFGTTDVIGEQLEIKIKDKFDLFTVTGLATGLPHNSILKVDMLLPFLYYEQQNSSGNGWFGGSMNTFLLLSPETDVGPVEQKMQIMLDRNIKDRLAQVKEEKGVSLSIKLSLQPLTDIHLSREAGPDRGMRAGSDPAYWQILAALALFMMLIASINFINLTVAQSLKRSKEIGIRKVVGSTRTQLVMQFLSESLLASSIAFVIAIVTTTLIIPFFNDFSNKKLSISNLSDVYVYAGSGMLLVITAFMAGFYPSLVLSAFKPAKVLYSRAKIMGKNYFSKGLIVVQFALSAFLIIALIVINSQMSFLFGADLGYDPHNLVRMDIPGGISGSTLLDQFKNELTSNPNIISVAGRHGGRNISSVKVEGKIVEIENNNIDDNFLPTFKIPIISGRNFSTRHPSDVIHSVIVNEAFVREVDWKLSEAVGKTVSFLNNDNRQPATVIGVVKDYHFRSLKEKIAPALFSMNPQFNFGEIWVRISPVNVPGTISSLERSFTKLVPLAPYTYRFMDEINARNYAVEAKLKRIISIASALFILISCSGLLGLVMLSIEQRIKEIGIRRVLGAAVSQIVALISNEFTVVIGLAFAVAAPVAYFVLDTWLRGFAYRIMLQGWMFATADAVVMAFALLIVSTQAIKAASINPAQHLRSE